MKTELHGEIAVTCMGTQNREKMRKHGKVDTIQYKYNVV